MVLTTLHLSSFAVQAKEGDVPEGSAAWTALSAGDQNKRRRSAEERATKLRSPNFSMSRTRLAVRNVPPTWDEKKLRELFIKAVKERATQAQPRVAQVKILREDAAPGGKAVGRSKGVGFVEFGDHEHALCALRQLNNNPAVWGAERRPVVEFAVDDVKALKLREARQAKAKLAAAGGGAPAAAAPAAAAAREQAAPAARRPTASAVGNDGEPKSKRKLRKERREMLKEISKRKEAEAEAGPAAGAPLDKAADKAQKRSQRRRLQRQRQKPGAEAAVPAARPAGGRGAPPPGVVQQSSRRKRAPEDLDALAQGGSEGRMVQRPRRQRDALDQLADKYVAKLAKGGDEGRVKPAAGKPKGGAEKRWFE
jgi:nucleolar protein 4